ncbi:MAG: hypothetical protein WC121_13305 [Candidatus Kapaibacterium sp.]
MKKTKWILSFVILKLESIIDFGMQHFIIVDVIINALFRNSEIMIVRINRELYIVTSNC